MLNALERKLLYVAQAHPTWRKKQIAYELGISESRLSKIWTGLESAGVIKGTTTFLDPYKCGLGALAFIEAYFQDQETCDKALEVLTTDARAQEIHSPSRGNSLFLKVRARETSELVEFKQFLWEIGGRELTIIPILGVHKETNRLPL